jgi:hypothetical protein
MIKITNLEIEQLMNSNALSTLLTSTNLPIKARFALSKLDTELQNISKIYLEVKQSLIQQYCDKDEEGNPKVSNNNFTFSEHGQEFSNKMNELLVLENDLEVGKVKVKLDDLEKVAISARDLTVLSNILEIEEDE